MFAPARPGLMAFALLSLAVLAPAARDAIGQCTLLWDPAPGTPGTGGGTNINSLLAFDDDGAGGNPAAMFAGGEFTMMGGVSRSRIAKWNGTTWASLGAGVSGGTTPTASAMFPFASELLVGGRFTTAGSTAAANVARWNGSTWNAIGSLTGGTLPVKAFTFVPTNGRYYAAGDFTAPASRIAWWTGTAWGALAGGGFGANSVNALFVYDPPGGSLGEEIYATGTFTQAGSGNIAANRIARWNLTTWSAVGSGLSSTGRALAVFNNELYVGGDFATAGGVAAPRIARWNGAWAAVGSGIGTTGVHSLAVHTDIGGVAALYAGGNFVTAGGVTVNMVAKWNGTTWSTLSLGIAGATTPTVFALAGINDGAASAALFAAGSTTFSRAGYMPVNQIARWTCQTCDPPFITSPPQNQSACVDQSVSFTVGHIGSTSFVYQWRRDGFSLSNGGSISGATTATLTINPVSAFDASNNYTVIISNPCGSVTSSPASLTIATPPTADAGPDQYVCDAGYVQLAGTVTDAASILWSGGAGTFDPDASSPTATYAPSPAERTAGSVTLTLTGSPNAPCMNAAMDSATIFFSEDPNGPPATPAPIATPDCITAGNSATLSAGVPGAVIDWYTDSCGGAFIETGNAIMVAPTTTTTYYAQARVGEPRGTGCLSAACGEVTVQVGNCPVDLAPYKDNTLIESSSGDRSDGAGQYVFSGRTNQAPGTTIRRAVLAFDVAGGVPSGATITSVSLTMNVNKTPDSTNHTHTLHRLLADWGEGASNPGGNEGGGAISEPSDATWLHRFFDTSFWAVPGGDFVPAPSGSQSIGGVGNYTWASSPEMVADVQAWLDDPATNFGWIILGNESINRTAKRFAGRGYFDVAARPKLHIVYQIAEPPTITDQPQDVEACDGDAASFTVTADGAPPLSYQWRKDTMPIPGATSDTLTIDPVTLGDAGEYDIVVSNASGSATSDTATLTVDTTPPTLDIPADITAYADAGGCTTTFDTLSQATVSAAERADISFVRSDGQPNLLDPYAAADSPIALTWTATDDCGNSATGTQTIVINPQNEILVDVELSPNLDDPSTEPGDSLSRCISFELWNCPAMTPEATMQQVVSFPVDTGLPHRTNGVSLLVPCGAYTCLTARDPLHSLRSTAPDFADAGATYAASFVGNRATGGHWLLGGNLTPDESIDVVDFASFVVRYGRSYASRDTTCATPLYHADITGDAAVLTGDFTFININFLKLHEPNCCSQSGLDAPTGPGTARRSMTFGDSRLPAPSPISQPSASPPILSISVTELWRRGMGELAAADLNGDGMVDLTDMDLFSGAAPAQPVASKRMAGFDSK